MFAPMSDWLLVFFSLVELALLSVVVVFFLRLKKSEVLLGQLQSRQAEFLNKLTFNAQLEQEMVSTFEKRQAELAQLDQELEARAKDLGRLLRQADELCRSPQFLRQIILAGHGQGKTPEVMAKATGLSVEEVEMILEQAKR